MTFGDPFEESGVVHPVNAVGYAPAAGDRGGKCVNDVKDIFTENGSSPGHNLTF